MIKPNQILKNWMMGAVVGLAVSVSGGAADMAVDESYNVILIMADDFGVDSVATYGSNFTKTPNISNLAGEGVRFDYAYSQPICTPSRVKIMSGQSNARNYSAFAYMDPSIKTFGHLMQGAGFKTTVLGKWQLFRGMKDPVSIKGMTAVKAGFDEHFIWQASPEERGNRYWGPMFTENGIVKSWGEDVFGPDLVNEKALEFIEENRDEKFFLYYPMLMPHDPFVTTPDSPDAETDYDKFVGMVAYTDKLVGKVRQKVLDLGIEKKTVIIFTGDNGTSKRITTQFRGKPRQGAKGVSIDAGSHVPFITWGGPSMKGAAVASMIDFADVLPTIAELGGVEIPADFPKPDGQSLVSLMTGDVDDREQYAFIHFNHQRNSGSDARGRYVFDERYKLYERGKFVDMMLDPLEENPINGELSAAEKQVKAKLEKLLEAQPKSKHWKPVELGK